MKIDRYNRSANPASSAAGSPGPKRGFQSSKPTKGERIFSALFPNRGQGWPGQLYTSQAL